MDFKVRSVLEWENGQNVMLSQSYKGVPVYGAELSFGLMGDIMLGSTGELLHGELELNIVPELSPAEAVQAAREALDLADASLASQPGLMIYDLAMLTDVPSDPRLIYLVDFDSEGQPRAFIDAQTGTLVDSSSKSEPALDFVVLDGLGLFLSPTCAANALLSLPVADENGIGDIPADRFSAVFPDTQKAFDYVNTVYNYFFNSFNMDSYDGKGGKTTIMVELKIAGTVAINLDCFLAFNPDTVTLDLVAHEFAHSLINLEYKFESGALNESFADIMASLIDGNWTFAEDIGAFRSLADPPQFGNPPHPDEYSEFRVLPFKTDDGGVHSNSGIMNKAAWLMTEGGTFNGVTVNGIGLGNVDPFLFSSMRTFTSTTSLHNAATHMRFTQAPMFFDLQGLCAVQNALYAVQLLDFPDINCDGKQDFGDNDSDNFPLNADNCPSLPNDQADTDGDGIGNACDEDIDGDGVPQVINSAEGFFGALFGGGLDSCPQVPNKDQKDTDKDGLGDACDPNTILPPDDDYDGDGLTDQSDNCQQDFNPSQKDFDQDGQGDSCDTDDDNDGALDTFDNCYHLANPDQADGDKDGNGNACDDPFFDPEGDGFGDAGDNCKWEYNPDQKDTDQDGKGDDCDGDNDGDTINDLNDNCPLTPNPDQADEDEDAVGDECDWLKGSIDSLTVEVPTGNGPFGSPGDLLGIPISQCEPDQGTWYSDDFAMGLRFTDVGEGIVLWVSGGTDPFLTKPTAGQDQSHLFGLQMGRQYFLNITFGDDVPAGETYTLHPEFFCGPYTEFHAPPTLPDAPTPTPTTVPSGLTLPYLTLLQNGNCRTNPGPDYELLDILPAGFQASINGVVPDNAWLRIFLPDWNQNCWLFASVVEVTGDLAGVTVYQYAPPPTPTTDPDEGNGNLPQCSDGLDNDGDGFIDDVDRECADPNDNDETS